MKLNTQFGELETQIAEALERLNKGNIQARVWERDYTLWGNEPDEISDRLGWLDAPTKMPAHIPAITEFSEEILADGFTDIVLIGMGGSSLAPELFAKTFTRPAGHPRITIMDSTHPGAVTQISEKFDAKKTFFIVATKSGGTVETISLFKYFYNWLMNDIGEEIAGDKFAAITDPGSTLETLSQEYQFRKTFLNDPDIGGRYSALSYFGLVPAGLAGVDLVKLLGEAQSAARLCGPGVKAADNPAAIIGTFMAEAAISGRDKLTFSISSRMASFGDWVEQLIAESTGKDGKGILPVLSEADPASIPRMDDRAFVLLKIKEDPQVYSIDQFDEEIPVIEFQLNDIYDLGGQFFLWEMATAIAGYGMGIQPFNQPNVEAAKILARQLINKMDGGEAEMTVESKPHFHDLAAFLAQASNGDYAAIQAYLAPNETIMQLLDELRSRVAELSGTATSLAIGPRYLHSTGQLHKGDAGKGLFVQIVGVPNKDVAIPDKAGQPGSSLSFGELLRAQAHGDEQALKDAGRRVLSIALEGDHAKSIKELTQSLDGKFDG